MPRKTKKVEKLYAIIADNLADEEGIPAALTPPLGITPLVTTYPNVFEGFKEIAKHQAKEIGVTMYAVEFIRGATVEVFDKQ